MRKYRGASPKPGYNRKPLAMAAVDSLQPDVAAAELPPGWSTTNKRIASSGSRVRLVPVFDAAKNIILYDIWIGRTWYGSRRTRQQCYKYTDSAGLVEAQTGFEPASEDLQSTA